MILLGLLPVLLFLLALVALDSYRLVRISRIIQGLAAGAGAALLAFLALGWLRESAGMDPEILRGWVAPVMEESLKALFPLILLALARMGFAVDAAILGASAGAGFAALENLLYLYALPEAGPGLWLVRGFGTAVLHAGCTLLVAVLARAWKDRWGILAALPGLLLAILLHAGYNHFLLPPLASTLLVLLILPPLVLGLYLGSERSLGRWLQTGFDLDVALLEAIRSGRMMETSAGAVLRDLRRVVPGEMLADLLCYLRLHGELSLRAKGLLLMREAELEPPEDPELAERFRELEYLERSLGPSGRRLLVPLLGRSSRELWQILFLREFLSGRP